MSRMADAPSLTLSRRWIIALCIAAILLGLAAHLAADMTYASPDLLSVSGRPALACRLLATSALPAVASLAVPCESGFAMAEPGASGLGWMAMPPALPSPLTLIV